MNCFFSPQAIIQIATLLSSDFTATELNQTVNNLQTLTNLTQNIATGLTNSGNHMCIVVITVCSLVRIFFCYSLTFIARNFALFNVNQQFN